MSKNNALLGEDLRLIISRANEKVTKRFELLIATDLHFLADEDALKSTHYSTTATQISPKAEWYRIGRQDFLERFL